MTRLLPPLLPLAIALVLTACGHRTGPLTAFRAPDRPIYSNAVLDLNRIEGRWTQVAAFANGTEGCRAGGAQITPSARGLDLIARLCLDGTARNVTTQLVQTGPGRLSPRGKVAAPLNREWWLLWADVDTRTLVFGAPDGSFGFILNRDGALPADRLAAARQVLNFNGYDITRLRVW